VNLKAASVTAILLACTVVTVPLAAQHDHHGDSTQMVGAADAAMSGEMSAAARKHVELSPMRTATRDDSVKARAVIGELRRSLAKYRDTSAAVADGYQMFAPKVKAQRIYHFTNYRNAFMEAFRFDPEKPTSILYQQRPDGSLALVGAMYTMPKRASAEKLDERVPLSIARWHKHVNWCVPRPRQRDRWFEQQDGHSIFGPESPIATRAECDEVGGLFFASPMGWMVHANVFAGDELGAVFTHER